MLLAASSDTMSPKRLRLKSRFVTWRSICVSPYAAATAAAASTGCGTCRHLIVADVNDRLAVAIIGEVKHLAVAAQVEIERSTRTLASRAGITFGQPLSTQVQHGVNPGVEMGSSWGQARYKFGSS